MKKLDQINVVHTRNRSSIHYNRLLYARSVQSDFVYVDFKLRWHDVPSPPWKRYLSWVVCGLTFPNRKKYDLFISSGPQFPIVFLKLFRRIARKQKIVCYLGSETLYFLYVGRLGKIAAWATRQALGYYDGYICNGPMQAELLKKLIAGKRNHIYINTNGIRASRRERLMRVEANHSSYQILFIGDLYGSWRAWYKGIDLMIEAMDSAVKQLPQLTFSIVGKYDELYAKELEEKFPNTKGRVKWVGHSEDVISYLEQSSLYLHCSRGDAYPNAVLEAMAAGVPPIVSEWTGTKYLVASVSPTLISSLDAVSLRDKIIHYFRLNEAERRDLSKKARTVVKDMTEDRAVERFQEIVWKLGNDIDAEE